MCDQRVGPDSPVGRLEEPLIHRSSLMATTPEQEEIRRSLGEILQPISPPLTIPRGAHEQRKALARRVVNESN